MRTDAAVDFPPDTAVKMGYPAVVANRPDVIRRAGPKAEQRLVFAAVNKALTAIIGDAALYLPPYAVFVVADNAHPANGNGPVCPPAADSMQWQARAGRLRLPALAVEAQDGAIVADGENVFGIAGPDVP